MTTLTLSAQEAADRLGVSYDHTLREVRAGRWPCHRFGRLVRFTEDDLAVILERCAVTVPEPGLSPRSAARLGRAS